MKWAKKRKLIAANPIADAEVEKQRYEVRGGPSLSQVRRILAALTEPRHTQIAVLAFTGARAGELQRFRPEDVGLTGSWVHIRSREGARTKTGRSRKVPIHACLRPLLEKLPRQQPWLFTAPPSNKYSDGSHWLSVKRLNEDFLKVLKRLGLPAGRNGHGFTVHSLRHFFETHTVNAGIPQRAVDCWLGHVGDQSMAAKYYKLSDEESQAFMARIPFGTGEPAADAGTKE